MGKNIRRIIAMALAIGTISAVAPVTGINLLTTKVYAAENSNEYLDSLNLYDEDGDEIKLYENSDYTKRVEDDEVEAGEVYYAKTTSDTINFDTDGPSDSYVRVFRGSEDTSRAKETDDDIKLDSDSETTTFVVKVFGNKPADDIRYKDCDDYDVLSTYRIKVKHVASDNEKDNDDSDNANDYDDIYLDKLSVNGAMINLSKSQVSYTYNVGSDVEEVSVRATPQDDYDVTINGEDASEADKYKSTVDLDPGTNKVKIEIEDKYSNIRVYTLNINRGNASTATETSNGSDASSAKNKWILVSGQWQYKDAAGNTVKNSWVQNYFVKADGNMATGWLAYNGKWYYLGYDGAKKTGWQKVNGIWYYLDTQGVMQTGWVRDISNGKYYYLNTDGSMAYNKIIGGYKLGADGAWIGR